MRSLTTGTRELLGVIVIHSVRVRERFPIWAALLLGVFLTASFADVRQDSLTIDGVALGQSREQVATNVGAELHRGAQPSEGLAWYQYRAGKSTTTVSFSAHDRCVRIRGNQLRIDDKTLAVGSNRHKVIEVLGQPSKVSRAQCREVLEFARQGGNTIYLVLERGAIIGLSAGESSEG